MGKRRYKTIKEAEDTARHQITENNAPELKVYACAACMGWHLTKKKN